MTMPFLQCEVTMKEGPEDRRCILHDGHNGPHRFYDAPNEEVVIQKASDVSWPVSGEQIAKMYDMTPDLPHGLDIIGAGMAGLLAGQMLRRWNPILSEGQPSLPHNHAALLRFRSDVVAGVTGIPFRKVTVTKEVRAIGAAFPAIQHHNQYSHKVIGRILSRSTMSSGSGERYIAPPDFIEQLSRGLRIEYGREWRPEHLATRRSWLQKGMPVTPLISTIPMPTLMTMVEWKPRPLFEWRPIWTWQMEILKPEVDVYQTIYYPDVSIPCYRASLTGNRLLIEFLQEPDPGLPRMLDVLRGIGDDFGLPEQTVYKSLPGRDGAYHLQTFGKLLPIPEQERRQFILAMTDQYRVYSLGRFATWRQILLDDVVKDVRIVEGFMSERDAYQRTLTGGRGQ